MAPRPVETFGDGGVSISGRPAVELFRLTMFLRGLILEDRTGGRMRLTRGPLCSTLVRQEFGFKGKRPAQIAAMRALILETRAALGLTDDEMDGVIRAGAMG